MINFFRRIRQQLLAGGKFSKYLPYAFGEIVLVVIGILIALQLNNWRENQIAREKEIQIYKELKSDLQQTQSDIEETIELHREALQYNQNLIFYIHDKVPLSDSVYNSFVSSSIDYQIIPKTSAFENLKNIGLNTLTNDSLRMSLTNLFQLDLMRLEDELGMAATDFSFSQTLFPYQNRYINADLDAPMSYTFEHADSITVYRLGIINYDQFLADNDLLRNLQLTLYGRSLVVDEEVNTLIKVEKAIEDIDEELKSLGAVK